MGYLESHPGTKAALEIAINSKNQYEILRILNKLPNTENALKIKVIGDLYRECKRKPFSILPPTIIDNLVNDAKNDYRTALGFIAQIPTELRNQIVSDSELKDITECQIRWYMKRMTWDDDMHGDYCYEQCKYLANSVGRTLTRSELTAFLKKVGGGGRYGDEIINELDK